MTTTTKPTWLTQQEAKFRHDYCSDIHLVDVVHPPKRRDRALINWYAVLGITLIVIVSTIFWVQVARGF